jgi:hypothetical protein
MCDVLLPPGVNPTAVKYIHHIIWSCHGSHVRRITVERPGSILGQALWYYGVYKLAVGQIFLRELNLYPHCIIPQMLQKHSIFPHSHYIQSTQPTARLATRFSANGQAPRNYNHLQEFWTKANGRFLTGNTNKHTFIKPCFTPGLHICSKKSSSHLKILGPTTVT